MKKRLLALFILAIVSKVALAQEKMFSFDFYGFIRNDFYSDTYKGLDIAHENFYVVPLYAGVDANGNDINQQQSSNLTALASRAGVRIAGPVVLNAQTSAVLEGDFAGITKSEPNLFRIRLAFVDFMWDKVRLRMGQDWHPAWAGGVFPTVASFNTGTPFQPFNRSPLIRTDFYFGNFSFGAALTYENQFTSKVMESATYASQTQAQRNGGMPAYSLFLSQQFNNWKAGLGGELKRIQPRMSTEGTGGVYRADEYLLSYMTMAFLTYENPMFNFTARGVYGQNMTHLTMLGGYAVATQDATTGAETYTNYNNYTVFANAVYGQKWQVGAFVGYGQNLGTSKGVYNDGGAMITAGLLPNVQSHWRTSAHLALNVKNVRFILEYELTEANYGIGQIDFSDGLYDDTHNTANHRALLSMVYSF